MLEAPLYGHPVPPEDLVCARDVLLELAGEVGLPVEEAADVLDEGRYALDVREAEQAWQQAGIQSVPAIVINQRLLKDDTFTSIHIENFEVEIRETKLGREEFTRDIPNVSERALRNLDENGVIAIGARVGPGDILVGKVSPKSKSELSPEEKLLHAIFGRAGEDVKNDSLEVPAGTEGVVIGAKRFSRRMHLSDDQKKQLKKDMADYEAMMDQKRIDLFRKMVAEINRILGIK